MVRKWTIWILISLGVLSLLPFALIARARTARTAEPRIHVFPDMDNQGRYKSQQANRLFADTRAMRPPVEGPVARGQLQEDDHLYRGIQGDAWATGVPMNVDRELLERGRERYDIHCSPCHGLAGYGDGVVARRADALQEGTWVQPSSLHTELVRSRPSGHIFNTITNGIRNMPPYGFRVSVEDRWAVTAYVHALQISQNSSIEDVPEQQRANIREQ